MGCCCHPDGANLQRAGFQLAVDEAGQGTPSSGQDTRKHFMHVTLSDLLGDAEDEQKEPFMTVWPIMSSWMARNFGAAILSRVWRAWVDAAAISPPPLVLVDSSSDTTADAYTEDSETDSDSEPGTDAFTFLHRDYATS